MRVAFFSPLPPARSGIADYSATLVEHLRALVEIETFSQAPASFDPRRYDAILYQLGNNPHHTFVYEAAMAHPGIIVLHEANLHHLIADLTIRRGDWDAYLREVELDGGPEALAYAQQYVKTLERGPDYDLPLLHSVLARSRAVIVHSDAVADVVRARGYSGPIAKIPHGAWTQDADGAAYRARLGVGPENPLIGIFGFLKPYKRITESLRAFRRVVEEHPEARMILVGEKHPELPLALGSHVRHVDFPAIEDFNGYLAACDIVLNLRFPTVGETSGTLLRALGMGKPVVVSDVGAFREYPEGVCLKAPVDATEERHLFEYMKLLIERPDVARGIGERARAWVERECSWPSVAQRYIDFVAQLANGEYILTWTSEQDGSREYAQAHLTRLGKTLAITPPGGPSDRVLEMGAYMQITPALKTRLGYGEVRGCYLGPPGRVDSKRIVSTQGEEFCCEVDHFDAEKDRFPYEDESFSTVLCCELVEHLSADPMHMMCEIHRVLKRGGHLVLTTPNVASLRAVAGILQGMHPMFFPAYIRPNATGEADPRHAREYTPMEAHSLLENAGFTVTRIETGPFLAGPAPNLEWARQLLQHHKLQSEHRGEGIYIVGRKTGEVRERYPSWLYS